MTRRELALIEARLAGYHADARAWTRALCMPGASREAKLAEYRNGERQRAAGVRCDCHECRTKAAA